MGHTYYYYYEVDGSLETHDPAVPSTTTCPYLPGQRVNTFWVPIEQPPSHVRLLASHQRSASVNAVRPCEYRTMDPADRYLTPRPPPATPSAATFADLQRPLSPQPHLLRHQRSNRSLTPSVTSLSSWSPHRFFARRTSPSGELQRPTITTTADDHCKQVEILSSSVDSRGENYRSAAPRLASSSSVSSFLSISSIARQRQATLSPAPVASHGSRSRDISPESLRRFLVDDVPLAGPRGNVSVVESRKSLLLANSDNGDDDDNDVMTGGINLASALDDDDDDDDEHNFATSTTSETAPMTILSPPPPPQARAITPPKADEVVVRPQQVCTPAASVIEKKKAFRALPAVPTRKPPAIPAILPRNATVETRETYEPNVDVATSMDFFRLPSELPLRLSLNLDLPAAITPTSPLSFSPVSLSSVSGDWKSSASHAASTTDDDEEEVDDDDDDDDDYDTPVALYHPSLEPLSRGADMESNKAASQQHRRHHHHHLVAAALAGSTATLVPGSGSGLDDLVDELGWMATAIQG
ncbi:MAG: hypothetical protein STHCBS139747_007129 [Sporothrix thermara]